MRIDDFLNMIINLIEKLGAISWILTLVITVFILNEAKKIRKSFIPKIRIPEAYKLLAEISFTLLTSISSWPEPKQEILKEQWENDKKQVKRLIRWRLEERKGFFKKSIVNFS